MTMTPKFIPVVLVLLPDTCKYKRIFHHIIPECNDFYSMEDEDQGSYLPGWKGKPLLPPQNRSVTLVPTPSEKPQVKGPWDYQSGDELKTYPYWGYKATYSAGGRALIGSVLGKGGEVSGGGEVEN